MGRPLGILRLLEVCSTEQHQASRADSYRLHSQEKPTNLAPRVLSAVKTATTALALTGMHWDARI